MKALKLPVVIQKLIDRAFMKKWLHSTYSSHYDSKPGDLIESLTVRERELLMKATQEDFQDTDHRIEQDLQAANKRKTV
jgi:hypothetical protein